VRPAHDDASTRYSALGQIDTANVKTLQLAWTFSTGVPRGHEVAPIVANNTMYIIAHIPGA
jgi:glucose dehydrogenase